MPRDTLAPGRSLLAPRSRPKLLPPSTPSRHSTRTIPAKTTQSTHAPRRHATADTLLPTSIRDEIAAIRRTARRPGAPLHGALHGRRLPDLCLLRDDRQDGPEDALDTEE